MRKTTDAKKSGSTPKMREMDLGISCDIPVVIPNPPKFEVWDFSGYKYYPKIGFFKFCKPEESTLLKKGMKKLGFT